MGAVKPKFRVRLAKNGEEYFVLTAANGQVLMKSETYKSRKGVNKGIDSVKRNAAIAVTSYEDVDGESD